MATDVIYAEAADGDAYGFSAVYATARSGGGSLGLDFDGPTSIDVGQTFLSGTTYYTPQGFVSFARTVIGTDIVSAATLSLFPNADHSDTDFTINARPYDWGTTVTTADYRDGSTVGALTPLLAHFATSAGFVADYFDFANDSLVAFINTGVPIRMVLVSDRLEAGTTPTGNEFVQLINSDSAGTTNDPKLTVTHAPAVEFLRGGYSAFPKFLLQRAN